MEGPMMEARALTPLISLSFLPSLLSFLAHHHHHPCLAASSISFLGGIGIALFSFFIAVSTSLYSHIAPRNSALTSYSTAYI